MGNDFKEKEDHNNYFNNHNHNNLQITKLKKVSNY